MEELHLNVALLRSRVPNLTVAAREIGLRPATVSNLCTGKIPIGRAEVQTLARLADLAGCPMDELVLRGSAQGMIETGIKVLDLFAPLIQGGTVGLVAGPHTGQLVMLAELTRRLKGRQFATILWKPDQDAPGVSEAAAEADKVCSNLQEVCEFLTADDRGDVLLAADRAVVLSGELYRLYDQLPTTTRRRITTILVDTGLTSIDEELPYGPLDTFLKFDPELITRGLYPAVDPVSSTSVILEGARLGTTHLTIQQQARKWLRRYRELRPLVAAGRDNLLPGEELIRYRRGERLEAYLSQPFYIAEPYTHKPGEWVPLNEILADVKAILEGAADQLEIDTLKFAGRLQR